MNNNLSKVFNNCVLPDFLGKDVYIAYSGGEDSRVLLELCKDNLIKICNLKAVHVNHGLHKDSDKWEQDCIDVCKQLKIPILTKKLKMKPISGESLEKLARDLRRKWWAEILPKGAALLLAHHLQDQVETVLHRLFKGAGTLGLGGMQEKSKFAAGWLLRPLLSIEKKQINDFATEKSLTWINDPSNQDDSFDRNFIRNNLLPEISTRWPAVQKNISRTSQICLEESNLLQEVYKAKLGYYQGSVADTLSIKKLSALALADFKQVLRVWLQAHDLHLSNVKLEQIHQEILLAKNTVTPKLHVANKVFCRYRDDLYLLNADRLQEDKLEKSEIFWQPNNKLEEIGLSDDLYNYLCYLHKELPKGNNLPLLICRGKSVGEKAKKIFQSHAIPPWERGKFTQIFHQGSLLAIVDLWVKKID